MAEIKIVQKEDPILHHPTGAVTLSDITTPKFKKLIADLKKALSSQLDGVAIAAPQIGSPLSVFVVAGRVFDTKETEGEEPRKGLKKESATPDKVFINPTIIKISKDRSWVEEGCLSVRYLYGKVRRATKTRIRAYDEYGRVFELGGVGLLSQIFQHEMDHLRGVLFIENARDIVELSEAEYAKQQK